MIAAQPAPTGPPWIQILLTLVGAVGGLTGVGAIATVLVQRRKFRADAADVLTGTALTLVDPLRARVSELQSEVAEARQKAAQATEEIGDLRAAVREMTLMMRRWRTAIFAPNATVQTIRELVAADQGPGSNGSTGPH